MYNLNTASGLNCSPAGLFYGSAALVKADAAGRYAPTIDPAELPGLAAVARALNEGNLVRADIAALHLRLPPIDPVWLVKAGFNPGEARDENGRWTMGGTSGDSSSEADGPASPGDFYQPAGYLPVQELVLPGIESEQLPDVVKPPLDTYPTDPTKPPGPGYVWKGKPGSRPGQDPGNWVNEELGRKLNPDLNHKEGIEPHWDFRQKPVTPDYPNAPGYRWYPDGTMESKKSIVIIPDIEA